MKKNKLKYTYLIPFLLTTASVDVLTLTLDSGVLYAAPASTSTRPYITTALTRNAGLTDQQFIASVNTLLGYNQPSPISEEAKLYKDALAITGTLQNCSPTNSVTLQGGRGGDGSNYGDHGNGGDVRYQEAYQVNLELFKISGDSKIYLGELYSEVLDSPILGTTKENGATPEVFVQAGAKLKIEVPCKLLVNQGDDGEDVDSNSSTNGDNGGATTYSVLQYQLEPTINTYSSFNDRLINAPPIK